MNRSPMSLNTTEELDFAYLLELMPPLQNDETFAWLPELFSIIGYERLIMLCKYAGGETIKLPTIEQLSDIVEAFKYYYGVYISKTSSILSVPVKLMPLFSKISECYAVANN